MEAYSAYQYRLLKASSVIIETTRYGRLASEIMKVHIILHKWASTMSVVVSLNRWFGLKYVGSESLDGKIHRKCSNLTFSMMEVS